MATKTQQPTTLEDIGETLHVLVETVAQVKEDMTDVKQCLVSAEQSQKDMLEELKATHGDVQYVRATVSTLVRNDAAQDGEIDALKKRMARVEKKVGIAP